MFSEAIGNVLYGDVVSRAQITGQSVQWALDVFKTIGSGCFWNNRHWMFSESNHGEATSRSPNDREECPVGVGCERNRYCMFLEQRAVYGDVMQPR